MKRVAHMFLAVWVMTLFLTPVTAQANWTASGIRLNPLQPSMAETTLLSEWEAGLEAANALYGNMFWALDYIDAWTQDTTWENLALARTACILISGYLDEYEYPQLTLTDDQMAELANAGVALDVLGEYYEPDADRLMMHTYFRKHLLPGLDASAIWAHELENVKDYSTAIHAYLQTECDILRYATNYLCLPLYNPEEGEALIRELKATYPVLFPREAVWIAEKEALEEINVSINDETIPTVMGEMDAAILRSISRSENAVLDFKDGMKIETLSIAGAPDTLPVPQWYDVEAAGFICFRYNEDKTLYYPACGDTLVRDDCNIYLQQTDISLEQVEAYMETVSPYAQAVTRTDNSWTVQMKGYHVSVSWENQVVTMTFLGESSTLMYN